MEIVNFIDDFFDMLISYLDLLKSYLKDDQFTDMLMYLYRCIPEEIKGILVVFLLLFLLIGLRNALKN